MSPKKIGLFVLILFIIGSIDSLRNMPAAAMFGPSLIFFFITAAVMFLIPIALLSAELSSYHKDKNGVYQWVKEAFGDKTSMITIWLQWINTAIWFPTILSFIAGGFAYLINPALAHNKLFVVSVILIAFWSMTLLSLKDLSLSAKFAAACAFFGFVLPFLMITGLLIVWLVGHHPVQIHIHWNNVLPSFDHANSWVSLTAIFTAFLGMELAAVNVKNLKNPQKTYPVGVIIAASIILTTMIIGSLAIAFVIPAKNISLISGIFEMLGFYLKHFHLTWMVWIFSLLIVFASLGEMINWIVSPARGIQQAAETGSLPAFFAKSNKHGMPANVLILQAIIVTIVCMLFALFKSVNDFYWLLTDLSTELYLLMYIVMFIAALVLHYKHKTIQKSFKIPGGIVMKWVLVTFGIISSLITIIVGFIPPSTLQFGGIWQYASIFAIGLVILTAPGFVLAFKKH